VVASSLNRFFALADAVSSIPMAAVWFIRLRSAKRRAAPQVVSASLTVCQSQSSSSATSDAVAPGATWSVAHLAARVVNRQLLAAMRWSWSTQLFFGHSGFGHLIGCFFHPTRIGTP
jgi:hypothetical protein